MEEDKQNEFFNDSDETIIDAEEIPQLEGICQKCFGSHFAIRNRNGSLAVLFTSTSRDSEGKPIKTLIPCDCNVQVNF